MSLRIDTQFDPNIHGAILLDLMTQYARDLQGEDAMLPPVVEASLAREIARRPGIVTAIAFVDDEPAGFCIGIDSFSTFACKPLLNVHDMFVVSKFRGRRIGAALLASMESIAHQKECCKITLEVLEHNHRALRLYQRCGFEPYTQDPALGKALFYEKKL